MRFQWVVSVLLLLLAGCASDPDGFGQTAALAPGIATVEPVFFATSRKATEDSRIMFGRERAADVSWGMMDISIPVDRAPGKVSHVDGKPDPAKDFTMISANAFASDTEFTGALRAALAAKPAGQRSVLVFVHGYNVNFAAGIFGAAQLRHDYDVPGIVVHYSWPSASSTALYMYDRDSAELARNGLARTIRAIEAAHPEKTLVLAHSMGTLVTMEAVRTLSLSGKHDVINNIDALVLAAPDIDVDLFQSQLSDVTVRPKEMVVIVSEKDRALKISSRLRGGEARVGQGLNKDLLTSEGIVVLDVAALRQKGDALSHSTFANSQSLIRLVRGGLNLQALHSVENGKSANLVGDTLGSAGDLLSSVVYLPARIAGAR